MKQLLIVAAMLALSTGVNATELEAVAAPDAAGLIEQVVPVEALELDIIETQKVCPLPTRRCKEEIESGGTDGTVATGGTLVVTYELDGYRVSQTWERRQDAGTGAVSWLRLSASRSVSDSPVSQ